MAVVSFPASVARAFNTVPQASTSQAAAAPAPAAGAPTAAADTATISVTSKATGENVDTKKNELKSAISDQWKSQGFEQSKAKIGDNGTIEGALRAKGYSLKEIYTKDKEGRTLADQVAQANGIKDARKMQSGTELSIPGKADGKKDNAAAAPEETLTGQKFVEGNDGENAAGIKAYKGENGKRLEAAVASGDSQLQANTTVGKDGHIQTGIGERAGGAVAIKQLAQNKNGSAATETRLAGKDGQSMLFIKDADKDANSRVHINEDGLTMVNPGGAKGSVKSEVALGPQSWAEKLGKQIDGWAPELLNQQRTTGSLDAKGVKAVVGSTQSDGSAKIFVNQANGNVRTFEQSERGVVQNWGKNINDMGNTMAVWGKNVSDFSSTIM